MVWKIADAKQRFSEVLRRAEREPQVIQNRDRVVAVVMSPSAAKQALNGAAPSMRDALADLRRVCSEADYALEVPERATRDVPVSWPNDPRRHKRS